ncbi:MAG: hypothetical protein K1X79_07050 [Oligoflexia bacterium]|nr:hypothetical protein [Oligoflexia bacterium]
MPQPTNRPTSRAPSSEAPAEVFPVQDTMRLIRAFGSEVVHLEGDIRALTALRDLLDWGAKGATAFNPTPEQVDGLARARRALGDKVDDYITKFAPAFRLDGGYNLGSIASMTDGQRLLLRRMQELGLENSTQNPNPQVWYTNPSDPSGTRREGKLVAVAVNTGMVAINPASGDRQIRIPAFLVQNRAGDSLLSHDEFRRGRFGDASRD